MSFAGPYIHGPNDTAPTKQAAITYQTLLDLADYIEGKPAPLLPQQLRAFVRQQTHGDA